MLWRAVRSTDDRMTSGANASLRVCLAFIAACSTIAVAESMSGATVDACSSVDGAAVAKLFGPTSTPANTVVDGVAACRMTVNDTMTLVGIDTRGGTPEFNRRRDGYSPGSTQAIHGYVDGAFFGWGINGSLDFVARRGAETTIFSLTGASTQLGFDSADPKASSPSGDVSGSVVGSGLWVLTTHLFANNAGTAARATTDDFQGLWRTTDITPCAPSGNIGVRVSRFANQHGSLTATKIAGDACLANGSIDFQGSTDGHHGSGLAFGDLGLGSQAQGTTYQFNVASPTLVRLTGAAGTLRYTRDYERLSWPSLNGSSPTTSTLLGIPSPSDALTAKNVALTGLLSTLLFLIVVFPTMLFNSTLEANLDHYRVLLARLRKRLPTRLPKPLQALGARSNIWQTPRGIAVYLLVAGLLFSLMQPGWGPNLATIITFVGFLGALLATSTLGVIATRVYLSFRYKQGGGKPRIEPSTLGIAAVCVAASRIVGFVPGYLYGVFVSWETQHQRDDFDRGRIVAFSSSLTLSAAIVAWLLVPACRDFGGDAGSLKMIPLSIVSGVFVGAVHALTIGLLPLHFLPGKVLRDHSPRTWLVLWASGGFLFVLVLLRPGLVSGETRSIVGTSILATVLSALAVAYWAYHRSRVTTPRSPQPARP